MAYAIKVEVADTMAATFRFVGHKTMYGGKHIAPGDQVFVFASERAGGQGLIVRGVVTSAEALPRPAGVDRWTPRVSITVQSTGRARRPLGRAELTAFRDWRDGAPQTELNFKFYRQATDKIVGLSAAARAFLEGFF